MSIWTPRCRLWKATFSLYKFTGDNKTLKYVIHVGIHKTASTFLQRRFFPAIKGIRFCEGQRTHKRFMRYLIDTDDLEFSQFTAMELFENDSASVAPAPATLLSDEQLYGSAWDGCALRKRICDRLVTLFPEAQIVVVLRNQFDLLQSLYLQYVKTGGSAHWRDFLHAKVHPLIISDAYFKYGNYIAYLMKLFGNDRVTVLLYEDLKSDPIAYLNRWCDILGVEQNSWDQSILRCKENRSISPLVVPMMRFVNKFISSRRQPYLLLPRQLHPVFMKCMIICSNMLPQNSDTSFIPNRAAQEFLADCYESSRRLEQLIDRDLRGLGYP